MAKLIGCKPSFFYLLLDMKLLYKYYCGSLVPVSFRLVGPGSNPKIAKRVMKQLPAGYSFSLIAKLLSVNFFYKLLKKVNLESKILKILNKKISSLEKKTAHKKEFIT